MARRPSASCLNSPKNEGCVLTAHSCKMTKSLYTPSLMISLKLVDTGTHRALTAANGDRAEHIAGPEPALVPPASTAAVASARRDSSRAIAALVAQCDALSEKADRDQALELMVRTAQQFSHATSAAAAWMHDEEMICLGKSGDPAPDLGARIDIKTGLSGECVRTKKLVRCDDASTDPRVHPSFYRALRLRSILALPLIHDGQVKGVLEVFSTEPKAFGEAEAAALQLLAGLIVEILSGQPGGPETLTPATSASAATIERALEVPAGVATLDKDKGSEVKPSLVCRCCRFRNRAGHLFCGRCGVPLNSPMEVASTVKRTSAGGEAVTNSAEVLKGPVADKYATAEYSAAFAEPIAHVSWQRLSHEIIAGFEGSANSNPVIHSVSRPPVAVNPVSPESQSPAPKPPQAGKNDKFLAGRVTKWFRSVAG